MRKWGFLFLIGAGLIFGVACTPLTTDYRLEGFRFSQRAFDYFEETPEINRVIELEKVRVHIIGSSTLFDWEKAAAEGSRTAGYATSGNDIYLLGKRVGGKLIINQAVLGHELNHLLNFKNPEIADPDRLDLLEQGCFSYSRPDAGAASVFDSGVPPSK